MELLMDAGPMSTLVITGATWLLGIALLFTSYWWGGAAWKDWLKLTVRDNGVVWRWDYSGVWAEAGVFAAVLVLTVIAVEFVAHKVDLPAYLAEHWPLVAGLVSFTFVVVTIHSIIAVRTEYTKRRRETDEAQVSDIERQARISRDMRFRREFAVGYMPYNLYCTILYGVLFVISALAIVEHFRLVLDTDLAVARAELDAARNRLMQTAASADPSASLAQLERIQDRHWKAIGVILGQINTTSYLLYAVLALTLLVEYTPIRFTYTASGRIFMHAVVAISLLIVLGVAYHLYLSQYTIMASGASSLMKQLAFLGDSNDPHLTRRFIEIRGEFEERQGALGFASLLWSQPGGIATIAALAQSAFSYLLAKVEKQQQKLPPQPQATSVGR